MTVANGMYLLNKYNIVIPLPCYVVYTTIAGEYCDPGFCTPIGIYIYMFCILGYSCNGIDVLFLLKKCINCCLMKQFEGKEYIDIVMGKEGV